MAGSPSSRTPRTTSRRSRGGARRSTRSASTSTGTDREDREADLPDFDGYYEHLRTAPQPADDLAALGRRLPRRLRAAARRGARHRLDPPRRADLRHLRLSARRRARPASTSRAGDGRIEVVDSPTACGGLGLVVLAAAAAAARGRATRGRRRAAREARAALQMWFARRHARVPAPRRADRRGQAWLGTALKIKPILTLEAEITPVERVRTSKPRVRADGRLPAQRATTTAPTRGSSSTSRRPTQAERLVERGREIFGSEPLLRVGGRPRDRHRTSAPGCSASAGSSSFLR